MLDLKAELDVAKELAVGAGAILMGFYAAPPPVEWKGANDPVTAADRAASRFIVAGLQSRFPDDAVLSEEEKDDVKRLASPRVWVVDPMDGTKEFIARRNEFSVMIGLAVQGVSVLGVVFHPAEEKLYFAAADRGAYLSRRGGVPEPLKVSGETELSSATMALSRSHFSKATEAVRIRLGIERTIQMGSIGLKVGLLCEGLAHVYVQGRGSSLWDTCGPEALLKEAGGRMTDAAGLPFRYDVEDVRNLQGVIATNGLLHDQVVETARTSGYPPIPSR